MPFLLRAIRKNRWYLDERPDWLPPEEAHADTLADLNTAENALSVWHIDDDQANLRRVAAALAGTRQAISNLDYLLVDTRVIRDLGIEIEPNLGFSADPEANANWHRDLVKLSATQLAKLATVALKHGERARIPQKDVRTLLAEGRRAGQLPDLKPELVAELRPLLT
ncbi:MAG: hypothetical protein HY320_03410 [Armatimonadetes bacterium]|nr:hypothetical protein [Armatimonadota bacterium]